MLFTLFHTLHTYKREQVMGVGGGLKGHSMQNSSASGRAGKPYGWMVLLFIAFGALLIGVMALHKHRERRVFDLVIKDKDLQLHSLHLHLQVPTLPYFSTFISCVEILFYISRGK